MLSVTSGFFSLGSEHLGTALYFVHLKVLVVSIGVVYVREKLSDLTTSAMFSAISCGTFFNVQLIVVLCPYDGEMILPSYLVKLFADSAGATSML